MKRFTSLFVLIGLLTAAEMPVFAQKSRTSPVRKVAPVVVEPPLYSVESVRLGKAGALTDGDGVYIAWQAEMETGNAGFIVKRIARDGSEGQPNFVPGAALTSTETTVSGEKYSFFDIAGSEKDTYVIESLSTTGERRVFGPFAVQPVKSLKGITGQTGTEMRTAELSRPKNEMRALNLDKTVSAEVEQNTVAPDLTMQRWVASQPGVKIGVKQQGFYRVTRAELVAAGFNVNSPSSNWQLYVDGVEQSIVVAPDDSFIEFYGRTIDTPESGTKIYYLIAGGTSGKRIASLPIANLRGVQATGYPQSFTRKDRTTYLTSGILNGDDENFFGGVPVIGTNSTTVPPTPTNFTFTLTGVDTTSTKALIYVKFQGISVSTHQVVAKLNGTPLPALSGVGTVSMSGSFAVPTSSLVEGLNTLQVQAFGGGADITVLDTIRVDYVRRFVAEQNRVSFYTTAFRSATVSNFASSAIRLFDITAPDSPSAVANPTVEGSGNNFSVKVPANRGRVFHAVSPEGVLTAASVIQNFPSTLSTPAHNAQLIILSHRDWLAKSEDWANYRRGQGFVVEVVDIEDVYDEYSYGSMSTTGVNSFLNYAKNNWQTPPAYVLIMGDASYDYRNYQNRVVPGMVPTKRVDTVYEETGSDEAMCDFNNDGVAEIAVGRLPIRSGAEVTQLLTKTQSFESTIATAWSRGGLFASDLPNGYDFDALGRRVAANVPSTIPVTFVNRADPDSRNTLIATLNSGKFFVNYSGHGSTGIWDGNWFTTTDAPTLVNSPNYTLYFMLTCLNGYFLRPDADGLAESVLKAPNGGAVASWASTGKTTPDVQEVMAARFYSQFGNPGMTRLGDLINDAKVNLNGGRDVRLSWALLGDPMLRIKP